MHVNKIVGFWFYISFRTGILFLAHILRLHGFAWNIEKWSNVFSYSIRTISPLSRDSNPHPFKCPFVKLSTTPLGTDDSGTIKISINSESIATQKCMPCHWTQRNAMSHGWAGQGQCNYNLLQHYCTFSLYSGLMLCQPRDPVQFDIETHSYTDSTYSQFIFHCGRISLDVGIDDLNFCCSNRNGILCTDLLMHTAAVKGGKISEKKKLYANKHPK